MGIEPEASGEFAATLMAQDQGIVRTWGAGVLRPYMIVPGRTMLRGGRSRLRTE